MEVKATKLTDVTLLQSANSFTSGKESRMTLERAYAAGHTPIRTQLFWIECTDVPLFVASQFVRSHVGVQAFMKSKRIDRGGEDFREVCESIAGNVEKVAAHLSTGNIDFLDDAVADVRSLPTRFDRYAPTNVAFLINAEALMNMAHKRFCMMASVEARILMQKIKDAVEVVDPALAKHLVPMCVYRGGNCTEPRSCHYNESNFGTAEVEQYKELVKN